jgi:hypothetical protein
MYMKAMKRHLQESLKRLETSKKQWKLEYPNPDVFWNSYRDAAQVILDSAGPKDRAWVEERVEELMEGR